MIDLGKAIEIFIAKENFMRHEIQGGRKFYKKYKTEAYHALEFKPEFQRFAELNLHNIAKKVRIGLILKPIEIIHMPDKAK